MVELMGTCHHDTVGQTCFKPKSPEPLSWGLKLHCGHTLPSTMVNPAACLAGKLGTAVRHRQWDVRGCDLSPSLPITGKTELNINIFSGEWRLTECCFLFFFIAYIQVYNHESQPTLCSYIDQHLVQNIIEEKSDQLYVYHSPLEGEKKRKTAWFLILERSHLSHLVSNIPANSINKLSFK